ncbi:hypothetical protein QVZ41_10805 [Wenyingzhuangia sp. chi5]|uniref:Uncharacterized protein n=1 Tax=Wenyingzhuangia gilva TaxID=3057677 RepID=A0ABT8VTM4_9FLAO|nr:hypothetical protein [Wenyingzhuangia sp. chi5]MDO3695328.1 hypothetical protein [Wenyingzhuangia sp. chi5]
MRNSTINLTSNNAWLYLESIKPSTFLNEENDLLDHVKINGSTFNIQTDRVAIYGSGSVIIPNGKQQNKTH